MKSGDNKANSTAEVPEVLVRNSRLLTLEMRF